MFWPAKQLRRNPLHATLTPPPAGARVSLSQVVADHQPPSAVVKHMEAAAAERGRMLAQLPAPFATVAAQVGRRLL